jgi:Na+/proline symporter
VLLIGLPTVIYTIVGGVQAVTWTDVKQMVIIILGILSAVVILILGLPDGMSLGQALHVAGAVGRRRRSISAST